MAKKKQVDPTTPPLRFDPHNPNRGTTRGRKFVAKSLERYGAGRSIVADRDGVIIAGNKTLEAAQAQGMEVEIIPTDGSKLIVLQRTDVSIGDERGQGLAVADNRAAELGLDWDPHVMKDISARLPDQLKDGFSGRELQVLFAKGFQSSGPLALQAPPDAPAPTVPASDLEAPAAPPPSNVRMVHLYLTDVTLDDFAGWVEELQQFFGTDNVTDTVYKAVELAYATSKAND